MEQSRSRHLHTPRENYLVLVDYYSDFWELNHLADMTADNVIQHCKAHFSRHGIPGVVVSDNGGEFGSINLTAFAKEWEFEFATTSPYHSQSNGKSESAVNIAKKVLKKVKRDGKDIWKPILDWRNTLKEGMDSSPAQRLMSRRIRTTLPTATKLLTSQVVERVPEKIKLKRKKAKYYYGRGMKELPELKVDDRVRVQPVLGKDMGRWKLDTCTEQVAPRSYTVDIQGRLYRRNRKFLRTTREGQQETPSEHISQTNAEAVNSDAEQAQVAASYSVPPLDEAVSQQEDLVTSQQETPKEPSGDMEPNFFVKIMLRAEVR